MRFKLRKSLLGLVVPLSLVACVGQLGGSDSKGDGAHPIPPDGGDPGRVTLHRLNRAEYNNTVHDLLGTRLTPAVNFPADDFAFGFDNLADTLSLSPVQLELYELTAQNLVTEAMVNAVPTTTTRFEAETLTATSGAASGNAWNLYSNGEVDLVGKFPSAGDYKVRVRAQGDGVRVTVDLTEPLPARWVGKIGFNQS